MSVKRYDIYAPQDLQFIHEKPDGEWVSTSDYDSLLAVLRRCVDWMEGQFCPEDTNCANCAAGRFIVDAAREFTKEAGKWK